LLVVLAVAVKVQDGGPVLYRARRVGRFGKEFRLFKFRTMLPDADRNGAGLTTRDDGRITPVGRFLRKFKLDEFPQLLNVLRGEMSFVGPRPEDPRYVALYTPEQQKILEARPGITSRASLAFRDESSLLSGGDWERRYVEEILPKKLRLEAEYLSSRTMWSDLGIILRTILTIGR
jgi:lipopolysaccharide/colanic/teichoic acid biosynthesis glycosyltransferase